MVPVLLTGVVIANKSGTQPVKISDLLKKVILEWNPGIVRTMTALIQIEISRRGYPFHKQLSNDLETQIGWLWHYSKNLPIGNKHAINEMMRRMMRSIEVRLQQEGIAAIDIAEILQQIPQEDDHDNLFQILKSWCGADGKNSTSNINPISTMHALNAYQSSVPFEGKYVTTGTVMMSNDPEEGGERWWVCVQPACDTVPEQANEDHKYIHCRLLSLFKLHETDVQQDSIENASQSRYLFVKCNEERVFLSVENEKSDQPNPISAYVNKVNQVEDAAPYPKTVIHIPKKNSDEIGFVKLEMSLIAQLHEPYANRLLHITGHHLSRIGLDFVDWPTEKKDTAGGEAVAASN